MKNLAKVLIVTMVLSLGIMSLVGCGGKPTEYAGVWIAKEVKIEGQEKTTAEEAGLDVTLTLANDGEASLDNGTQQEACTWEEGEEEATITMGEGKEPLTMKATLEEEQLILTMDNAVTLYMEKEE